MNVELTEKECGLLLIAVDMQRSELRAQLRTLVRENISKAGHEAALAAFDALRKKLETAKEAA